MELRIRAALGAILSKPSWWIKWQQDAIRGKWIGEIEAQLIFSTVDGNTLEWTNTEFARSVLAKYDDYPAKGTTKERRQFLSCPKFKFELIFVELSWFGRAPCDLSDEQGFKAANARMQPYSVLIWYFELEGLTARMSKVPLRRWRSALRFSLGTFPTITRVAKFLVGVRAGTITRGTFAHFAPTGDHRPLIVDAVWFHVDRIMREMDDIRSMISNTLEGLIAQHPDLIFPGFVEETWTSDHLIDASLKSKFIREVTHLTNVSTKDWHPFSDELVLDVVHPSLHCCVFGTTKCAAAGEGELVPRMQRIAFSADRLVTSRYHTKNCTYQWIPSDFQVMDNGDVQIRSYINNLHPVEHEAMYSSIQNIFKAFVPMFERVLGSLRRPSPHPVMVHADLNERDTAIPCHPPIPEKIEFPSTRFELRGKVVQVIVKIAEIHLTPQRPFYPGGAWHVEGSDAEQIVATGIYYFGCKNVVDSTLGFRTIVKEPIYTPDDDTGIRVAYGLSRGEPLVQTLGSIPTVEDRCIVFPNTIQHCVSSFRLRNKRKPGVRKILAFFLVDPSRKIPSTSVIPPQQEAWLQDLHSQSTDHLKSVLPHVVVEIVKEFMEKGMTTDEALAHRLGLMEERAADDRGEDHHLTFSLCEH